MSGDNKVLLLAFVFIACLGFSMVFGSCGGGGVSDDIARHAIDRAFVVRAIDEIANGGK